MIFRRSGGHAHDAAEGRAVPKSRDKPVANAPLAMDAPAKATRPAALSRTWG